MDDDVIAGVSLLVFGAKKLNSTLLQVCVKGGNFEFSFRPPKLNSKTLVLVESKNGWVVYQKKKQRVNGGKISGLSFGARN